MNDFLIDDNDDLLIANGDFAVGDSLNQEVEDILVSAPGWWKQRILLGVNINSYAASPGMDQKLQREATEQLLSDGITLLSLIATLNATTNELDFSVNASR